MGETNFTFGPIQFFFLFFDSDLLFPRNRASQASFKAVLIAVYMTNGLQTKCKTCFGGPRMILHALWKNTFFKKAVWFFYYLRRPPPGLAKDHKKYGFFFRNPSLIEQGRRNTEQSSTHLIHSSPGCRMLSDTAGCSLWDLGDLCKCNSLAHFLGQFFFWE